MKKSTKIIICILVVILVIAVIFGVRISNNQKLLKNMENAISNLISTGNFTYTVNSDNNTYVKKVFNNQKTLITDTNLVMYTDVASDTSYIVNPNNTQNSYSELKASAIRTGLPEVFNNPPVIFSNLVSKIHNTENEFTKILFSMKVSNDTINGIECYKITCSALGSTITEWVNKENFLPVQYKENDSVKTYRIEMNNVSENEVTFSDIDNYTKIENK